MPIPVIAPNEMAQARALLTDCLAELRAAGVALPEVDAAEAHHARMLAAEAHGYPEDARFSMISTRRYLERLPRPLVSTGEPFPRPESPLYAPPDACTVRTAWGATDGTPLVLAALCGVPVRDVAPIFAGEMWVRRTLPAMAPTLAAAGLRAGFTHAAEGPPALGFGAVQIDGPWRFDHPQHDHRKKIGSYGHWVGLHRVGDDLWVYDPFDLAWVPRAAWEKHVLPFVRKKRAVEPGAPWYFRGFYAIEAHEGRVVHAVKPVPDIARMAG